MSEGWVSPGPQRGVWEKPSLGEEKLVAQLHHTQCFSVTRLLLLGSPRGPCRGHHHGSHQTGADLEWILASPWEDELSP